MKVKLKAYTAWKGVNKKPGDIIDVPDDIFNAKIMEKVADKKPATKKKAPSKRGKAKK